MRNFLKNRISDRLIALLMTFAMMLSLIPLSSTSVMAAPEDASNEKMAAVEGSSADSDENADNTDNDINDLLDNDDTSLQDSDNSDEYSEMEQDSDYDEDNIIDSEEDDEDGIERSDESEYSSSNENQDIQDEVYQNELEGISVTYASGLIYTGEPQNLTESIVGVDKETDKVSYKITNGDTPDSDPEDWTESWTEGDLEALESDGLRITGLTAVNAGTYTIGIKVERKDGEYETSSILEPAKVTIAKANQGIKFANYSGVASTVIHNGIIPASGEKYDFSAVNEDKNITDGGSFSYSLSFPDDNTDMAQISDDGTLTVYKSGTVTVKAEISGNENYNEAGAEHSLTVKQRGHLISFEVSDVYYTLGSYTLGADENEISSQEVKYKGSESKPKVSYYIDITDVGISCDRSTGKVVVDDDYEKLSDAMDENGGELTITVNAVLEADDSTEGETEDGIADEASYTIKISYETTPEDAYALDGTKGTEDWYITDVVITPTEGYNISTSCNPDDFAESITFYDKDTSEEDIYIYLRHTETGGITAKQPVKGIKIDTVGPDIKDMEITYLESESASLLGKKFFFYDSEVTIRFTAADVTSGIDYFEWTYTRSEDASTDNLDYDHGTLEAVQDKADPSKYTAELTLPKTQEQQLRGFISVKARDKAGNESVDKIDSENIVVVDSIRPKGKVSYQTENDNDIKQVIGTNHYYANDVEIVFDITEANFFPEDVIITISKDGQEIQAQDLTWSDTANKDEHRATYLLSEDGTYVVSMTYTDRSGNKMDDYQSETIIIDKTAPVIEFYYADHTDKDAPQTATITIIERNFRQSDIEVVTYARNIKGEDVPANDLQEYLRTCTWTSEGDVHTAVISSEFVNAVYKLIINYQDIVMHKAEQLETEWFVVDHTAPDTNDMSVEYSTPIMETILSTITLGFYNPSVTVTITAYDITAGIDYFTWSFEKQEGINSNSVTTYEDTELEAVQDSIDKSKFRGTLTLPKQEADQLRGNIIFSAADKCGNISNKITDTNYVIIVDTIAPNVKAEYTVADRIVGDKMYYNKALTATFTVTETNFFSEDIVVELSKNKAKAVRIEPTWTDRSTDVHIGTYTINAPESHAGDGDYVFTISYTDRSNNEMSTYTSNIFVIDTIKPVIEVTYSNQNVIDTFIGPDGNMTEYYDSIQVATVTVNEHNFNPADMEITIEAKDHAGGTLDAASLSSQSAWSLNGDVNTMTITYPGDANYSFDVEYTDLATNKAADYETDYFTVDTEMPTDLAISYSISVLETILSNITFGFYNAKAAVTVEATDNISGVGSFKYSYINAEGVSLVNAESLEQVIEEAGITYSNSGMRAAATFEIPASELGINNQFNGTVSFNAKDRAGNESEYLEDSLRVVVDNMAPAATIEYNTPVQILDGISYFDSDIAATVTINEANFYSEDVVVSVTRDGADYPITPSWSDENTDVHIGNFTLAGDGDYFVSISYADKSGNEMEPYISDQLTLDTEIEEAIITVNGENANGKAFKDDVIPAVRFEDVNLESYEIKLTRTSYGAKNVDVTDKFIAGHMTVNKTGGSGTFDTFDKTADNDGIYTLAVSLTDKAGHSVEKSVVFTVNRFGSVYEYSDYLVSLINNGGAYVNAVENDLVITEYNADKLVSESLDIVISLDGRPLETAEYNVTPDINPSVQTGESGWYQYRYTIDKNNFSTDGLYKIAVSSADETGNTPENSNYEDKLISFWVDSTAPEINSITGLEKQIVNATSVDVNYTVYDTIGLDSVTVYVSGKEVEKITDFPEDINNYSGSFTLYENSSAQPVRLVVADIAGNITDTAADGFKSAYIFNSLVTVSTNFFVRWYADKMLFFGSIGIFVAAVFGVGIIIMILKRRKE